MPTGRRRPADGLKALGALDEIDSVIVQQQRAAPGAAAIAVQFK